MTGSGRVRGERLFPLGAIAGDVIGSVHERAGTKTTDFPLFTPASRFTDDSVLTVAVAVFLARTGSSKDEIRAAIATRFGYDLSRPLDDIRPGYTFDVTCQGSVPEALIAFLESSGWEDAVRKAISLGGDADTLACMAGAIAEAFYGEVPPDIAREVEARLDDRIRGLMQRFAERFVR